MRKLRKKIKKAIAFFQLTSCDRMMRKVHIYQAIALVRNIKKAIALSPEKPARKS